MSTGLPVTGGTPKTYRVRVNLSDGSTFDGTFDHKPSEDEVLRIVKSQRVSSGGASISPGAPGDATGPKTPAEAFERLTGLYSRTTPTTKEEPLGEADLAAMLRGLAATAMPMAAPAMAALTLPQLIAGTGLASVAAPSLAKKGRKVGQKVGMPETGEVTAELAGSLIPFLAGARVARGIKTPAALTRKVSLTPREQMTDVNLIKFIGSRGRGGAPTAQLEAVGLPTSAAGAAEAAAAAAVPRTAAIPLGPVLREARTAGAKPARGAKAEQQNIREQIEDTALEVGIKAAASSAGMPWYVAHPIASRTVKLIRALRGRGEVPVEQAPPPGMRGTAMPTDPAMIPNVRFNRVGDVEAPIAQANPDVVSALMKQMGMTRAEAEARALGPIGSGREVYGRGPKPVQAAPPKSPSELNAVIDAAVAAAKAKIAPKPAAAAPPVAEIVPPVLQTPLGKTMAKRFADVRKEPDILGPEDLLKTETAPTGRKTMAMKPKGPAIKMQPIASRGFRSWGYRPKGRILDLEFLNRKIYRYHGVVPQDVAAVEAAPSKGAALLDIARRYPGTWQGMGKAEPGKPPNRPPRRQGARKAAGGQVPESVAKAEPDFTIAQQRFLDGITDAETRRGVSRLMRLPVRARLSEADAEVIKAESAIRDAVASGVTEWELRTLASSLKLASITRDMVRKSARTVTESGREPALIDLQPSKAEPVAGEAPPRNTTAVLTSGKPGPPPTPPDQLEAALRASLKKPAEKAPPEAPETAPPGALVTPGATQTAPATGTSSRPAPRAQRFFTESERPQPAPSKEDKAALSAATDALVTKAKAEATAPSNATATYLGEQVTVGSVLKDGRVVMNIEGGRVIEIVRPRGGAATPSPKVPVEEILRPGPEPIAGEPKYSVEPNKLGFYSQLERVVSDPKTQAVQRGADWIKFIKDPKRAVTADEMKWSGVDDFLASKSGERVTKQEILDAIKHENVTIEETVLGGAKPITLEDVTANMPKSMAGRIKEQDGSFIVNTHRGRIIVKPTGDVSLNWDVIRKTHGLQAVEAIKAGAARATGSTTQFGRDSIVSIIEAGALPHENAHIYLDNFATLKERGVIDASLAKMAKEQNRTVDEVFADGFSEWFTSQRDKEPQGVLHQVFARIYDFFSGIYRTFKPTLESTYKQVGSGKAFERPAISVESAAPKATAQTSQFSVGRFPPKRGAWRKAE